MKLPFRPGRPMKTLRPFQVQRQAPVSALATREGYFPKRKAPGPIGRR